MASAVQRGNRTALLILVFALVGLLGIFVEPAEDDLRDGSAGDHTDSLLTLQIFTSNNGRSLRINVLELQRQEAAPARLYDRVENAEATANPSRSSTSWSRRIS